MQRSVLDQFGDEERIPAQNRLDLLRRAVAAAQPDDFGRCATEPAALREIAVLCDHTEAVDSGVFPDLVIQRVVKRNYADVRRLREEVGETSRQPVAEVLIEKQIHAAEELTR